MIPDAVDRKHKESDANHQPISAQAALQDYRQE